MDKKRTPLGHLDNVPCAPVGFVSPLWDAVGLFGAARDEDPDRGEKLSCIGTNEFFCGFTHNFFVSGGFIDDPEEHNILLHHIDGSVAVAALNVKQIPFMFFEKIKGPDQGSLNCIQHAIFTLYLSKLPKIAISYETVVCFNCINKFLINHVYLLEYKDTTVSKNNSNYYYTIKFWICPITTRKE